MTTQRHATAPLIRMPRRRGPHASAWVNGFVGMLIFSGSLPATRMAVLELDATFITAVRAVLAAALAGIALLLAGARRPARTDAGALSLTSLGAVIGFPLLTALALRHMTAVHSLVYVGALPLATAGFGVLRGRERPGAAFWLFSVLGAGLVAGYAVTHTADGAGAGDWIMVAAVLLCGLGYAEGAVLSRRLGGWQVISWALLLALPISVPVLLWAWPARFPAVSLRGVLAVLYISFFSMWIGFVFWYRGMAQGGIAAIGQLQLLQPFFGLLLAALLMGEAVPRTLIYVMVGVVLCVAGARHFARGKP